MPDNLTARKGTRLIHAAHGLMTVTANTTEIGPDSKPQPYVTLESAPVPEGVMTAAGPPLTLKLPRRSMHALGLRKPLSRDEADELIEHLATPAADPPTMFARRIKNWEEAVTGDDAWGPANVLRSITRQLAIKGRITPAETSLRHRARWLTACEIAAAHRTRPERALRTVDNATQRSHNTK